jgi:hypothetical protein
MLKDLHRYSVHLSSSSSNDHLCHHSRLLKEILLLTLHTRTLRPA